MKCYQFFNNTGDGIDANGAVLVVGNTVFNNSNGSGITLTNSGAAATDNIVFGNKTGIQTYTNNLSVTYNRVYGNTGVGIEGDDGATITGNVVYSNSVGIESNTPSNYATGPYLSNNLVYTNTTQGIWILGGSSATIYNNTVYQLAGDALLLDLSNGTGGVNIHLDDNILWTSGAYDIALNSLSEVGFTSDYNDLYVTGTGSVGLRESISEPTLAAWQAAGDTDADSISTDPEFVNAAGGDFHPQSSTGSFHGGSLAPALNVTTNLPQANPGTLTADPNQSPTIDRGDPTAPYSNEPAPNGGVVNMGSFGDTAQASLSLSSYVLVARPSGGILLEGQTFNITWRSQDTQGTVSINLLQNGSPLLTIATGAPNSGSYSWSIPTTITPGSNFTIQVTRNTTPAIGVSADFTLASGVQAFFVNGSATGGSATFAGGTFNIAAGNDANSGLDPADAKATLQALLTEYNFTSGDVIYVDAATYNLSSNVILTAAADSGITIEGVASGGTIFDRTNDATGSYDFDLQGATGVTLENLAITGGFYGINASSGEGSTNLTVNDSAFYGDYQAGINLAAGNGGATITNSIFHDMSGPNGLDGIIVSNDDVTISNNALYNLSSYGITLTTGDGSTISGNRLYNDGTGISEDTATVSGNIAYHDTTGISAGGSTMVSGNTLYNDSTGITISGGNATGNIAYNNSVGINTGGTETVSDNLLFGNTAEAIATGNGATLLGNVAYGNGWGMTVSSYPSGAVTGPIIENNLLYDNTSGGIDMVGGDTVPILNNTIYQTGGVGFELTNYDGLTAHGVALRDNIFWNTAGPDIEVDPSDETGMAFDYNDLYATGTGEIGIWGATPATTLAQWQATSGNDPDSISTDPQFVSVAGDDFHLQSSGGSFHGGTLAPVLNASTGLPQPNPGVLTDDVNYSPAINAGSPTDPYSNEPAPNGGYVDLGSYGNSSQASLSKAHYLTVIRPLAGQTVVAGSATTITWRDEVSNTATGPTDTVDFAVLLSGNSTPAQTFSGPDVGSYNWTAPSNLSAGTYTIEITRTDGTGLNASSPAFTISPPTSIYYVATNGSDSNSGLSASSPKATIAGVLNAGYTLVPGDTIEVAAGTYNVSSNIALVAADSGITIQGVAGGGTILNRGSLSSGSYLFSMLGATNITLQDLTLTDAYVAVNTNYGNTSTGLTVTGCTFTGEQYIGIYLEGINGTSTITNSTFSNFIMANYGGSTGVYAYSHDIVTLTGDTASGMSYGFYMNGIDGGTISNNTVYANTYGIAVSTSGVGSVSVTANMAYDNDIDLSVSGTDLTVSGNTVYKDSHANSSIVGSNEIGISLGGNAVVTGNTVYGNVTGIDSGGGQFGADVVTDNLVYNNTGVGISGGDGDTTTGNIVYDNGSWGIQYSLGYGTAATIANNLVYGNTTGGIDLVGAYETQVLNNTVYQTTGNAFELDGSPTANPDGLTLENNIFWAASTTATGYAVQFADSTAYSFVSDYNDLYATGNGQIAKESTQGFATLSAWVWELGQDVHSISADPQFVGIAGSNFNVSATSPTIDAGNPASAFSLEPAPNGGRINLGYTGDTPQAAPSPAQAVQVLFPSGTLKLQDGTGYTITWQSAGLISGTTATVALSVDGGNTWTQLATNVAMSSSGGGSLAWTPSVTTTAATGLIRVTASTGQVGISSQPFSLAGAGTSFYVSTTGNNANSGTSAGAPMSSIEAVLNSYHPGTGDTIFVAGGTYTLFHDIVIGPADTGITITGPTSGTAAVVNRNSTSDFGFSLLDGANNITIENLSITGAYIGINGPSKQNLGNSNITILNNVLYANGESGNYAGAIFTYGNSNWNISGNTIHDNIGFYGGIYLQDSTATITDNTVYNETNYGIYFSTPVYNTVIANNIVSGNTVSFCGTGIAVSQATVTNNLVEGCTTAGLYVSGDSVVTGNTAWGQTATNAVGINVEDAFVSNNLVYDNYNGIYSGGGNAEIFDNRVYSNIDYGLYLSGLSGTNADLGADYIATAYNNLVYANAVGGIYLTGDLDFTLINNTVYQVTGNAITNSGTLNATYPLTFENNVLYVESGYDIDIPSSPAGGLISDYNVLYHSGSADVGVWNGSTGATLAAWQALSNLDVHSSEANPLFVDPAGADGVLGYNPSGNNGAGYNGGADDNFTLSRGSSAIDDGFSAGAPAADLLGEPRVDDPGTPNTGSLMTLITNTGSNQFVANSGVAQNWNAYNDFWTLTFPAGFTFPFYGTSYSSVNVSSNGFLEFNGESLGNGNSDEGLTRYPVIAPLWEYLTTYVMSGDGSNIFVDTSVANQVTIRWKATLGSGGTSPINFAVVLFSNGNIRFDYGAGNTGLSPTIGLSAGDGLNNYYLSYDGASTLTNANSILVTILQNGYVDRGAYEFQGSSLNTTPPTVTAISPPAIQSSGAIIGAVSTITVTFSEPMNPIDASAPGEYILTGSNSATYVLTPQYTIGSTQVVLSIAGGPLPDGNYTFTIVGTSPNGIHDTSGNLLDGNGNGNPGSNYVSSFSVTAAQPVSLTGSASYYLRLDSDGQHIDVWNGSTDTGSYSEQLTPSQISALTITASGGGGTFIIDNSNGNVIPAIGVTLAGDGATSLQIIGSGAGDTITANAGQIVYDGVLINFSGTTQTTLNPNGGTDTLTVNAGTLLLAAPAAGSGVTVRRFSSITIGSGAELQVLTPASHSDRALIVASSLSIAGSVGHWTGTLDLGGNDLDIQNGSLSTLANQLAQGYNNGRWNGGGVESSAAASDTTHLTALGSMQNNQGGSPIFGTGAGESLFDGFSAGASDLLVKYTYYGDATLAGSVSATDYSRIDYAYLTGATGWFNGDFNYDGVVNGSDYTLIDNAFNMQSANLNLGPSYYLKLDADGQHIDIWNNATGTGSYAQQVLRSQTSMLTLTSTTGTGSFTIDNSAGDIYVAGGLTLTGDGNTSLKIIGTGGVDTVTATAGQIVFDGNPFNVSGIVVTTFTGNIDLPANALVISNGITYQSTGTLNLLEAGNASLSQPAINMSTGATLQLIGTTNSPSAPDIFFGPDSSGTAYFGPQILGGTLNLGSTQRFIESNSGHNSVAKYLLPSYDVDSLITSTIIGTAGFNYQGNEESTSGFYANLVLTASNTFTGPIEVNFGSVYLYPGASGATTVLQGDNQLTLNNSSGAGASYSHFFLLGGKTTISNLTSIGTAPGNTAIANGNPTMGFVIGPATLTINQTANTAFGGAIADTITDNYDSGSDVPGSLSVALTGTKDLTLTGNAAYTGTTTVGATGTPGLYLAPGASLGDTAVTVNAGSTFGAGAGSHLGDTNSNHSGGNLTINGGTLDMTAGGTATTIGTFAINQPSASGNNSLTLSGATLDFDAMVSGADSIVLAGPASVSGTNIINVSMLGTAAASPVTYNLITAPHGLLGTFEFANGATTETIPYGSGTLTLSLINTATAEELSISQGASASYYLKLDADGVHVDIWNNTTGTGGYAEQVLRSQSSALTLVASGGAGSITVDNSAGAVYVTGGLTLDGDGSTALKVIGTGNGDSITANAGQIIFDGNSFSFTGVTTETLDPHGGTDTLTVNAGKLMIVADPAGGGIVDRSFSNITIGAAAEVQVLTPVSHSDRAVLVVGGLTIAGSTGHWTGLLDLGGNDMDLQSGSVATVSNLVAAGYNFGGAAGWQAEGISSSAALADTTHLTTLGVIQNNQSGTALYGTGATFPLFDGISPGKADILVKYTYFGDATLQGSVSATDYSRIDNGYLTGATGWYNGDFNYDGVVNGSDYTLIDNAFNMQGASLAAEFAPNAAGVTVNQPGSAAVNPVAKPALQRSKLEASVADRAAQNGKISGSAASVPAANWSSIPVVPSWQSIWTSTSDSVADELFVFEAGESGAPFSQSLISD